ncbi:Lipase [Streptomyces venezuelae]|uniref:lipase family protein n=1 Tax=Streptomyces gardneri TaxID=66892 RepID=UPI0006BC342A|nr:lipase family protein [Streptomyces gardneri]ALO13109.1 Lipase [Streptomyces venezuelae]QPK49778.1 triacylglycerol lipase [Streptomyces gardneri]WRK41341.1 lipase family protein [Streptomyces venezuelae]CUM36219.1 Lipase 1 [Streptomyces venezuelae]
MSKPGVRLIAVTAALATAGLTAAPVATAATITETAPTTTAATTAPAAGDPFYAYDGSEPLSSFAPGAVLKTRTLQYHLVGVPTPLKAIQLLYRSTDAQGRPSANVTTVVRSLTGDGSKAVSYQSFYDSLNPEDGPSRAIAGNLTLGGVIPNAEALFMAPLLAKGYTLVIPDTQGQRANFAAGPEYGTNTLDSIRAATRSAETGLSTGTRFGLMGYSGGAIATNWAAAMAPAYAPDVNRQLVGFAEGGLLVAPAHNLKYVDGSLVWSGVIPMAVIGVSRSYGIDLKQYLNDYGRQVYEELEHGSIVDALGHYPGLTWKKMAKPQYADANSVPEFVDAVNRINLGSAATPTVPGFIAQGNGGVIEGTFANPPGIGTGDAVMVAGDVRALARQYCATGNDSIAYRQFNLLSHNGVPVVWAPLAIDWLDDRFAGRTAPSDCGDIPAGNSLAPEQPVPAS